MSKKSKFTVSDKRGSAVEVEPVLDIDKVYKRVEEEKIPDAPKPEDMNIEICGDRVMVQNFPNANTKGLIFIPNPNDVALDKGRVVGVGPDCKKVKIGDIVVKVAGMGQSIPMNNGFTPSFHPENAIIGIDKAFNDLPMGIVQDDMR